VIKHLKAIFARCGKIPAEMVSDNGPQFNSAEIHQFSQSYGFKQALTIPRQMGWLKEQCKLQNTCCTIHQAHTKLSLITEQLHCHGVP